MICYSTRLQRFNQWKYITIHYFISRFRSKILLKTNVLSIIWYILKHWYLKRFLICIIYSQIIAKGNVYYIISYLISQSYCVVLNQEEEIKTTQCSEIRSLIKTINIVTTVSWSNAMIDRGNDGHSFEGKYSHKCI